MAGDDDIINRDSKIDLTFLEMACCCLLPRAEKEGLV